MQEPEIHDLDELYRRYGYYEPRRRRFIDRLLRSDQPTRNYILFLLTFLTTFLTGYLNGNSVGDGLWYSVGIMSILLAHEMGHYVMCIKYGVRATLPFFIPFPPLINPFGTLGAVIRMEGRMPDRRALFDIGAGGPIGGLILTLPAIYFGIRMSEVVDLSQISQSVVYLGDSLLFKGMSYLAKGPLGPNEDLILHPLAYAGWVGLFVTALNLMPIGQLDGGHILYALFGHRSQFIYPVMLAGFALICIFLFEGWLLLLLLLLWFGFYHPPTLDPETPLDPARQVIAVLMFIIFIFSFTPVPFKLI